MTKKNDFKKDLAALAPHDLFHVYISNNIREKILDSDWLRAVQFKCNACAKSVTSVQITHS